MSTEQELLNLTQRLLDCIPAADWKTYTELCDESLTAFEPEARGNCVHGLEFHRYYFQLGKAQDPRLTTMIAPHVRLMGNDAAVVTYVRLVQKISPQSGPVTTSCEETRIWQRKGDRWKHVHFHRSEPS